MRTDRGCDEVVEDIVVTLVESRAPAMLETAKEWRTRA